MADKGANEVARNAEKTSEKTRTADLPANPSKKELDTATKKISK